MAFRDIHGGIRGKKSAANRSPEDWQQLCSEFNICKRKLQAKSEALLVLAKELDNVRQEKDAYKLMAEQLREKFHMQRRKYEDRERALGLSLHDGDPIAQRKNHTLVQILCEVRKKNKTCEIELQDTRQKLSEAEGDIKLLRESIARQRVGDEGIGTRLFPAHEREELIRQLERSREQIESLERDMVAKIDEHQEFVTERDYYRTKTERLNQELNYVLGGDDRRIVDVDALVMENKYLKEKISQHKEEKASLQATASKYKAALERRRGKGAGKLGTSGGAVLSTKDVENLLAQGKSGGLSQSPSSVGDLQSLATSLLEAVHDKTMALQHQKNTNKILGQRVAELEKKLKTLEVAGLWNLPAGAGRSAVFLAKERESMESTHKTLLPHQVSTSSDDSPRSLDGTSSVHSSSRSTPHSTPSHTTPSHSTAKNITPLGSQYDKTIMAQRISESVGATGLMRRDTEDSLIMLKEEEEEGEHLGHRKELPGHWSEMLEGRTRSQSSPSHCCHQNDVMGDTGDDKLIDVEGNELGSGHIGEHNLGIGLGSRAVPGSRPGVVSGTVLHRSRSLSSPPLQGGQTQRDDLDRVISLQGDDGHAPKSGAAHISNKLPEQSDSLADIKALLKVSNNDVNLTTSSAVTFNREVAGDNETDSADHDEAEAYGKVQQDEMTTLHERELLRNIYDIERRQVADDSEADEDVTIGDYDDDDNDDHGILDEENFLDVPEDAKLVSVSPCDPLDIDQDDKEETMSSISAGSLENLFNSVTDKFLLKSREKQGAESVHPSSPLLRKEKPTTPNLVIDNTPQCV